MRHRKANTMPTTSLAALDRCLRKFDDAFDSALASADTAEVSRTSRLAQEAHDALYNAVPQLTQCFIGNWLSGEFSYRTPCVDCFLEIHIRPLAVRSS